VSEASRENCRLAGIRTESQMRFSLSLEVEGWVVVFPGLLGPLRPSVGMTERAWTLPDQINDPFSRFSETRSKGPD
jgi:hypothetical protein